MKRLQSVDGGMSALMVLISALMALSYSVTNPPLVFSQESFTPDQSQILKDPLLKPLPPSDPRAKLDPGLLEFPPVPEPEYSFIPDAQYAVVPNEEVHYDATSDVEIMPGAPVRSNSKIVR